MNWLKGNFNAMRGSGLSIFGSACYVAVMILCIPYMKYKDWQYDRLPEDQKGFGKFRAGRNKHNIFRDIND